MLDHMTKKIAKTAKKLKAKGGRPLYQSFRTSEELKTKINKLAASDGRSDSSWIFKTLWEKAFPNRALDES